MQFPSHSHCIRPPHTPPNNSMGYARIFARTVSNLGPPDYSFDDINIMPFTRHIIYVIIGDSANLAGN